MTSSEIQTRMELKLMRRKPFFCIKAESKRRYEGKRQSQGEKKTRKKRGISSKDVKKCDNNLTMAGIPSATLGSLPGSYFFISAAAAGRFYDILA